MFMAEFLDLTGRTYGKLTVLKLEEKRKSGKRYRYYWECLCECGGKHKVRTDGLTSGNVLSCGCLKREQDKKNLTANHSHRLSGSRLWHTYYGILSRCYDKRDKSYERYGGRGIKVCKEWRDSFESFVSWSMSSGYNDKLTIDRINNNGNYEPKNCKWSDDKEQARNRRSNSMIKLNGELMTLVELSEKMNIPYGTASTRYGHMCVKRRDLDKHANSVVNIQMAKG